MCGRFTLTSSGEQLAHHFQLNTAPALSARYNIAPTQSVAVVRAEEGGERRFDWMRWGLVPAWADDPAIGNRMINARAETVADKPAYRRSLRRRRCLLAADGFYEWVRVGSTRQPHRFTLADGSVFAMAGLWDRWIPRDGEPVESCTIVTTEANSRVRPIHDRMPVILNPRDYRVWLDASLQDPEIVVPLLVPSPPDSLIDVPVDRYVNDVRHDDPGCIAPLRC